MTGAVFDLLIRGGICLTPSGAVRADIGVIAGKIAAIGEIPPAQAETVFAAEHLHILPGVIDTQVHFREPGLTHKESIRTGAEAAALGGVTGFFEMPNTDPPTTDLKTIEQKCAIAAQCSPVNYAFYVGGTADNIAQLPSLEQQNGVCGVKIFMGSSTGSLLVEEDSILRGILENGSSPVAIHAEDEARLKSRFHLAGEAADPQAHPVWRDAECALIATERIIRLAEQTKRPVHVLHISTGDELALLAACKGFVSCEVTPQHLTFSAPDCYERLGSFAQMNPPIRDETHTRALWQAVNQGLFDILGSDHAPHTREEKAKPYPQSPSGMPGVQTLVPVMLTHVNEGRLSLERFTDLTCAGPARIFNLKRKGRIAWGYDADFTIVDMKASRRISDTEMRSQCGWTPFDGFSASAWVSATIVGGRIVMRDDTLLETSGGKPFEFIR